MSGYLIGVRVLADQSLAEPGLVVVGRAHAVQRENVQPQHLLRLGTAMQVQAVCGRHINVVCGSLYPQGRDFDSDDVHACRACRARVTRT